MFFHSLLLFVAVASTAVTPSISRTRPRTARLSRGPAWTDFRSLAVGSDAKVEAEEFAKSKIRAAVVTVATGDEKKSDVDAVAFLMRQGFGLSQETILVDASTTDRWFADAADADAIARIAAEKNLQLLVTCQSNKDNVILKLLKLTDGGTQVMKEAMLPNNDSQIIDSTLKLRAGWVPSLGKVKSQAFLGRKSNNSIETLTGLSKASQLLRNAANIDDTTERKAICDSVLHQIDSVISADPNLLEAYLVKASCLDELGEEQQLKLTLAKAFSLRNPSVHSPLTVAELEGDYARFVQSDPVAAMEAYGEILAINESNLVGLWSLIDLLLSDSEEADDETLAEAATLAARLVQCHPGSSVAEAIVKQ